MRKHFISFLIGLISLGGIYMGVSNHNNQENTPPVELEENVVTDDSQEQDLEEELVIMTTEASIVEIARVTVEETSEEETTDNEDSIDESQETDGKSQETKAVPKQTKGQEIGTKPRETSAKVIDKVVNANSNDQIKSLYQELCNSDNSTVYKKVIINGQEYNNRSAQNILNDLVSTYGQNLSNLDLPTQTQSPVETQPPTEPPTQPPTEAQPAPSFNGNYASQVVQLVNQERANAGLSALANNGTLTNAANKRATEIVSVFDHTRPNGTSFYTVLEEYGVSMSTAGENIAYGQRSPSEVVTAWMNSSVHKANILNGKFGNIGVGVYEYNGTIYWTQLFTN